MDVVPIPSGWAELAAQTAQGRLVECAEKLDRVSTRLGETARMTDWQSPASHAFGHDVSGLQQDVAIAREKAWSLTHAVDTLRRGLAGEDVGGYP